MRVALVFACLVAVALAGFREESFAQREFQLFEQKFNKVYSSVEERLARFEVFKVNLEEIQRHNLEGHPWTKKVTQFADLTPEEFQRDVLNGYVNVRQQSQAPNPKYKDLKVDPTQLPSSVDWRDAGIITAMKDQGACGSCWAFAAVEQLESYASLESGSLIELSAQQLVSCTPNALQCGGTGGCAGSITNLAYGYNQLFGTVTEQDMPYTSGNFGATGDCDWDSTTMTAAAYCRGYEVLPHNDMDIVMNHLANIGPLAVSVDASIWSLYGGGVFGGCNFDNNIKINHAVQLIGYGSENGEDYWLIRNSWSDTWGEAGYMKIKRYPDLECGYDTTPLSGSACVNDGQETQYVCGNCAILFESTYPIGAYYV